MWLQLTNRLFQKSISGSINPVLWQKGIYDIDSSLILSDDLGGRGENKHRAWYGDKVLGAHVAKFTITFFQDSLDRRVASNIASVALSNRFLRQNVSTILPRYDESWTNKNAGTTVEAAVSRLPEEAIDDLAECLVKKAMNEIIRGAK